MSSVQEMIEFNNMRKHVRQFTKIEVKHLMKRIDSTKNLRLTPHLIDRIHEKKVYITNEQLTDVITNYSVVEYRILNMEERVVIRSNTSFYGEDYCIVISLTQGAIVTIWKNSSTDLHSTLNEELYNKKMKVF